MKTLLLAFSLLAASASIYSQTAPAQTAPAGSSMPACDGHIATVRISEIKQGGTLQGFLAAIAAHKAWYSSHGSADQVFFSPIIVRDEKTRAQAYSDKQFMTFHVRVGNGPAPKRDDAYDAFSKLYRENSEIKSEYNVCMPNAH